MSSKSPAESPGEHQQRLKAALGDSELPCKSSRAQSLNDDDCSRWTGQANVESSDQRLVKLAQLLEQRDQEIRGLKVEIEQYKHALSSCSRQQQTQVSSNTKKDTLDGCPAGNVGRRRRRHRHQDDGPNAPADNGASMIDCEDVDYEDDADECVDPTTTLGRDRYSTVSDKKNSIPCSGATANSDQSSSATDERPSVWKPVATSQRDHRSSSFSANTAMSKSKLGPFKFSIGGQTDDDDVDGNLAMLARFRTAKSARSNDNIKKELMLEESRNRKLVYKTIETTGGGSIDDILQDVGEIDLNLELNLGTPKIIPSTSSSTAATTASAATSTTTTTTTTTSTRSRHSKRNRRSKRERAVQRDSIVECDEAADKSTNNNNNNNNNSSSNNNNNDVDYDRVESAADDDDDEDIISQGLLTSLTDAAMNNLSQLAALQERCESQQQLQHSNQQQQQSRSCNIRASTSSSASAASNIQQASPSLMTIGLTHLQASVSDDDDDQDDHETKRDGNDSHRLHHNQFAHAPFYSPSDQSSMSLLVGPGVQAGQQANSNIQSMSPSSTSISSNSNIQADLSSSHHSLASAVAAAAAAAAAAASGQHQHNIPQHHHNTQTRLITPSTSAISSPDFYKTMHTIKQQQTMLHSPAPSSLHFSPSTSITPSPSPLMASSRRSGSHTCSSLMSPISSPNYLHRQFIHDHMPLLSPSPSSGLTTGTSSSIGTSSSLAHILQQQQQQIHSGSHLQHQQQRSASALPGGPISSSSSTPLSGTGSSAVSPLLGNKTSSQVRLNNMQIRHKFGYLGSGRAQFNSPHGFCLGLNQDIVVADTNNHRVCIFDKSGTYITQFGSPGKEEGQLWNPRKVAILHRPTNAIVGGSAGSASNARPLPGGGQLTQSRNSPSVSGPDCLHQQGLSASQTSTSTASTTTSLYSSQLASTANSLQSNRAQSAYAAHEPIYVVCDRGAERSRMQLFTKDGAFIKKIGIHYIDIVAGLAINQNGLIIVVDSVSPTVYIINGETGTLNGWFDCSGHMKEPSDIAVKSDLPRNEYFICDFKGHCVVVFSEQGEYLRKIGQENLTSYPNGIDISDDGDILVGDSHGNRFHVVVFDRNGNFVSQFECPHVKVSRCCGLKITREGYIVTLAKNNHHVLVLDTIHI